MTSLFCRHNRFTADCPICSRGTVLDPDRAGGRRPARRSPSGSGGAPGTGGSRRRAAAGAPARAYAAAEVGPYEDGEGAYLVRLEQVPGGLRLAEWAGGQIRRRAPRLAAGDLGGLFEAAAAREVVGGADAEALRAAVGVPLGAGASPGRAGEVRDELRVEPDGDGTVRLARWIHRPGTGWEVREAPVMLPAVRFVEALRAAGG